MQQKKYVFSKQIIPIGVFRELFKYVEPFELSAEHEHDSSDDSRPNLDDSLNSDQWIRIYSDEENYGSDHDEEKIFKFSKK